MNELMGQNGGVSAVSSPRDVRFIPLTCAEAIRPEAVGDSTVGDLILSMLADAGAELEDGDVLAVSSKVAAFYEGDCVIRLADVVPSRKARVLGRFLGGKDPRKIQLVLEEGSVVCVIPLRRFIRIPSFWALLRDHAANPDALRTGYERTNAYTLVVHNHAAFLDEAGIDHTNTPDEFVTLLPRDPCETAQRLRAELCDRCGVDVAVLLTDTVTCIGRVGSQDVAVGYAGIDPRTRLGFSDDLFGIPRSGGVDLVIDSIAGMAGLVMGQSTERRPVTVIRGLDYSPARAGELPGMDRILLPSDARRRVAFATVIATLKFKLGSLLSLQRKPSRWATRRLQVDQRHRRRHP